MNYAKALCLFALLFAPQLARAEAPVNDPLAAQAAANPKNFGQCNFACGVNTITTAAFSQCIVQCDRFNADGIQVPQASAPEATTTLAPVSGSPSDVAYTTPAH